MKHYKDIVGDGGSNVVAQVTEQRNRLHRRLASVRHIIAIVSGKGGVGKSSLTAGLATALALQKHAVGILDCDLNGASIAKITGVRGRPLTQTPEAIRPAEGSLGLKIMSIDLFLPDNGAPVMWDAPTQQDAFTWRGMVEAAALRELMADTEWGELDYLLLDLPPGTDKLPTVADLVPRLSGSIIVTLPSGVSQFVVRKSIKMATDHLQTPVLGVVENMSAYVCPDCGKEKPLFPSGEVEALAAMEGVDFLGKVPFDPRLAQAGDEGELFVEKWGNSPAGHALAGLADRIRSMLT